MLEGKKQVKAHRLAYELFLGPIPEGLVLDHVKARGCESTLCVNPDHLEPVSPGVNVQRGEGPCMQNSRKEKCVNGHDFDEERIVGARTYRSCSTCRKARGRKHDVKRRALKLRDEPRSSEPAPR